jgi:hypothetical protein
MDSRGRKIFLWLLMIAAGVEFGIRGPVRALREASEWNDFLSPYVQAKEWLKGTDPYSPYNFGLFCPAVPKSDIVAADIAKGRLVANHGVPSPYPLTSFVLLVPLAILPWPLAQAGWIGINLAAFGSLIWALLSIGKISWREPRGQLFLAMGLALAPFQTGLAVGNAAVLVVALSVGAVWMANQGRDKTAGILLGIAVCLKPPLGLCFLLHFLVCRRWKVAGWTLGWTAITASVALSRLTIAAVTWIPSYFELQHEMFAPGAINSFMPANPVWFHLINLQAIFYALWPSRSLANWIAAVLGFLFLAVWLGMASKSRTRCGLLTLGSLVTLSLLPFYHRFYDAALLIVPLCWSLTLVNEPLKRLAHWSFALMLPFMIPGAAILHWVSQENVLPSPLFRTWWWNGLVEPHATWALLALTLLLLHAMRIHGRTQPAVPGLANSEG